MSSNTVASRVVRDSNTVAWGRCDKTVSFKLSGHDAAHHAPALPSFAPPIPSPPPSLPPFALTCPPLPPFPLLRPPPLPTLLPSRSSSTKLGTTVLLKVLYAPVAEPGLICRPLLHLVTCVQVWRCDVWGVCMEGGGRGGEGGKCDGGARMEGASVEVWPPLGCRIPFNLPGQGSIQ